MTLYKIITIILLIFALRVRCKENLPALIQQVKPAVVTIYVYNEFNNMINQGSGFFLTPELVVSSRHVFWKKGATHAKVVTNKLTVEYPINSVLADDVDTDLVLLGVERGAKMPVQLAVNITFDEVQEGEDVFVISSPSGLKGVVSTGIVSAIHNEYDVQISAAISQGSSGAPIFNFKGEVVGVVVGHFNTGQNLNFGISVQGLTNLIKKLETNKNTPIPTKPLEDDNNSDSNQVISSPSSPSSQPLMLPDAARIMPNVPFSQTSDNILFPTIREWLESNMPPENTTTSLIPFSLGDLWRGFKNLTKGILNWEEQGGVCSSQQSQRNPGQKAKKL